MADKAEIPTCSTCLFFLLQNKDKGQGICRQSPPVQETAQGRWPKCYANEWCGAWQKIT